MLKQDTNNKKALINHSDEREYCNKLVLNKTKKLLEIAIKKAKPNMDKIKNVDDLYE